MNKNFEWKNPFNQQIKENYLSDKGYNPSLTLWTFTLAEIFEKQFCTPLDKVLKYWQILEYRTYQRLTDLKLRFRYSHPYCDNLLKSCDFTVYSFDGNILKLIECKYVNCLGINNIPSFVNSVLKNNIKDDRILYVVNRAFYSLLRQTDIVRENITTVSGLRYHLKGYNCAKSPLVER
jgi:hypothetical protein